MSAIKLPVHYYAQADREQLWSIRDGDNIRIGRDLTEAQAKQIAIALNCHDALVDAQVSYTVSREFYPDVRCDAARAALAKVEKEKAKDRLEDSTRYTELYCGDLPPGA